MTDYSINTIILRKKGLVTRIDNITKIIPICITVTGKVFNIRAYFETNIKSDMLAIGSKESPVKFKHYTEKRPLLLGDMKKGNKKTIWLRTKKLKKETIKDKIYGRILQVEGEVG